MEGKYRREDQEALLSNVEVDVTVALVRYVRSKVSPLNVNIACLPTMQCHTDL